MDVSRFDSLAGNIGVISLLFLIIRGVQYYNRY